MDVINRTFVGIRIPDAVAAQLQDTGRELRRKSGGEHLRWNAPSEYLIQLASLGEVSLETLGILRNVLPPIVARFPLMRVELSGIGGAPNAVQPRFVCAPIQGEVAALTSLSDAIWSAAGPYVRIDPKPFRPFVVLGRLKTESEAMRVALGRALRTAPGASSGMIMIDAVELLMTESDSTGIHYVTVERMRLGS